MPASEAGTATARKLWELLTAIAHAIPHCTLVVDGLDECAASHDVPAAGDDRFPIENRRASFLAHLKRAVSGTAPRVLIVSRDELDIRSELRLAGSSSGDDGPRDSASGAAADNDGNDDDDDDDNGDYDDDVIGLGGRS